MTKCIAFHSYKGGTGKSTIACNVSAYLCTRGFRVFLLDMDVYAPSLQTYFRKEPEKWINNFLSSEDTQIEDILIDMTDNVRDITKDLKNSTFAKGNNGKDGKLFVCFSNSSKEEIYKLDGINTKQGDKIKLLRKFLDLREKLVNEYHADYIVIDTSPGIRYWSINGLAIADTILLTLKVDDIDIQGTKKMAGDLYSSFTKFGARSYLLLNRVAGYCVPSNHDRNRIDNQLAFDSNEFTDIEGLLSSEIGMNTIAKIPCYCDIQFSNKEYLTVLSNPDHPFASKISNLALAEHMKV